MREGVHRCVCKPVVAGVHRIADASSGLAGVNVPPGHALQIFPAGLCRTGSREQNRASSLSSRRRQRRNVRGDRHCLNYWRWYRVYELHFRSDRSLGARIFAMPVLVRHDDDDKRRPQFPVRDLCIAGFMRRSSATDEHGCRLDRPHLIKCMMKSHVAHNEYRLPRRCWRRWRWRSNLSSRVNATVCW